MVWWAYCWYRGGEARAWWLRTCVLCVALFAACVVCRDNLRAGAIRGQILRKKAIPDRTILPLIVCD